MGGETREINVDTMASQMVTLKFIRMDLLCVCVGMMIRHRARDSGRL